MATRCTHRASRKILTKNHPFRLCCPFSTQSPNRASDDIFPDALPKSYRTRTSQRQPIAPTSTQPHNHPEIVNTLKKITPPSKSRQQTINALAETTRRRDLGRHQLRRWTPGAVYSPHDLSPVEMEKRRRPAPVTKDVFDILGMNPLDEYKNFSIMSEFCSSMGRIKHRKETGLRAVNQRKIAKAVRRAVGMGLLPSVHRHPEAVEVARRAENLKWFGRDGNGGLMRESLR